MFNQIKTKPIILIFTFFCLALTAQEEKKQHNPTFEYRAHVNKMLPHTNSMKKLDNGKFSFGNEFRAGIQTEGNKDWHHVYNFPNYGFGYLWGSYNNTNIGSHSVIYSFIDIPFHSNEKHQLSTNWALGVSFNIDEYHETENPQNIAIGTDKNAYASFSVNWRYQLSPYIELGTAIKLQHLSNGSIQRPNLGINQLGVELTSTYTLKKKKRIAQDKVDLIKKKYQYSLSYGGGLADIDDNTDKKYYCSSLSIAAYRRINNKRTIGLGSDIFYRGYLADDPNIEQKAPLSQLMSYGAFVSSEFIIHRIRFSAQVGVYIWRPYKYDVPYYERLTISYDLLGDWLYANSTILAHADRALCIEWGIGIRL